MGIEFKDGIQNHTVESLLDMSDRGELIPMRKEIYVRNGITKENIQEKKEAIVFLHQKDESDDSTGLTGYVKILEPLIFNPIEYDGNVTNELVSGNSRWAAIQDIYKNRTVTFGTDKDAYTVEVTEFEPIPTRTLDVSGEGASYFDLVRIQTATNDNTREHTPSEKARLSLELKARLEKQYAADGMGKKKAAGEATKQVLATIKQMTPALLSNYTTFVEKATTRLTELVDGGNISVDAAVKLIQCVGNKLKKEGKTDQGKALTSEHIEALLPTEIDLALNRLLEIAKSYQKSGATEDLLITKSLVMQEFSDVKKEKSLEAASVADAGGDGASEVESSEDEATLGTVTPNSFTSNVTEFLYSSFESVTSEKLTAANSAQTLKAISAMCDLIAKTNDFFPAEHAISIFDTLKGIVYERLSDVETIVNYSKDDEQLAKINGLVDKIKKPLEAIVKTITASDTPATTETIELQNEAVEVTPPPVEIPPIDDIDL